MEKNKNTLLLTVIAIATLLVAVIGATFAYFSASMSGGENSSSVQATAVSLYVDYNGGTATLTATEDAAKEPSKTETPFVQKEFSLTPRYNEVQEAYAYLNLPYTVNLVVTKNTFALKNKLTTASISYRLERGSSAGITPTPDGTYVGIPYYDPENPNVNPLGDDGNGTLGVINTYDNSGNATERHGVVLGNSQFTKGDTAAHVYTLKIYFLDDGENQDADKGKEFSAYIDVSTGHLEVTE